MKTLKASDTPACPNTTKMIAQPLIISSSL